MKDHHEHDDPLQHTDSPHMSICHHTRHPRIFVALASYRDAECPSTIHDLLINALYPDRIRIGLVTQFIPHIDRHLLEIPHADHISVRHYDARESLGACWAKSTAHHLWGGEEFVLSIDSHMRFSHGWDDLLLRTWATAERPHKTVISTYPAPYIPPEDRSWDTHIMVPHCFETAGSLRFAAMRKALTHPYCSLFLSGNFFFAPAHFLRECPYDPAIYQSGEEISMSVRAWTKGWNIVCPSIVIAQHYYNRNNAPRPHDDNPSWVWLHTRSETRVRLMLESSVSYRNQFVVGRRFGLGSERSLEDFETKAGICFQSRSIANWARRGELLSVS